jgi:phosphoadenosine phosphosulfate reductase
MEAQIKYVEQKLNEYEKKGLKVFASSSFQTHSIPMLHIISQINPQIPVTFLDTGFHFPETLAFRDQIADQLGIKIVNLKSYMTKFAQRDASKKLLFASDPDYCCYLNKTLPMEIMLVEYDIWITGVRKDQSSTRKKFSFEVPGPHDTTRFHPMLEWNSKMIYEYRTKFNLPEHPLEQFGYFSIGCGPCTRKQMDDGRDGRWSGMKKTECGLHTELVKG